MCAWMLISYMKFCKCICQWLFVSVERERERERIQCMRMCVCNSVCLHVDKHGAWEKGRRHTSTHTTIYIAAVGIVIHILSSHCQCTGDLSARALTHCVPILSPSLTIKFECDVFFRFFFNFSIHSVVIACGLKMYRSVVSTIFLFWK